MRPHTTLRIPGLGVGIAGHGFKKITGKLAASRKAGHSSDVATVHAVCGSGVCPHAMQGSGQQQPSVLVHNRPALYTPRRSTISPDHRAVWANFKKEMWPNRDML